MTLLICHNNFFFVIFAHFYLVTILSLHVNILSELTAIIKSECLYITPINGLVQLLQNLTI